jgi:hypothetical protein
MSTSISSLNGSTAGGYQQSIIRALQSAGIIGGTASGAGGIGVAAGYAVQGDASQLSPLAQILSPLQQLQESNPDQYQQVTAQIAANLSSAAQSAQSSGNPAAANELGQLASDFTDASQTGQLPNISDLAQAVGGQGQSLDSGDASSLNPLTIIESTLAQNNPTNVGSTGA